jgi:membrane protease YdiL (CAAX protease family)
MPQFPAPQPWQKSALAQLAAVLIGAGPMYALAISGGMATYESGSFKMPTLQDSLLNTFFVVVVFGGIILAVLLFLNGELPGALQLKPARLSHDLGHGLVLGLELMVVQVGVAILLGGSPIGQVPPANQAIGRALAADPWLLAFWLGPVIWLQAALIEELTRAFMLSRLWHVWTSPAGRLLAVLGSALLFGMGHAYQGAIGIVGTSVIGLMLGLHYEARGRVLPLIIAHGVYNSAVLVALVVMADSGAAGL